MRASFVRGAADVNGDGNVDLIAHGRRRRWLCTSACCTAMAAGGFDAGTDVSAGPTTRSLRAGRRQRRRQAGSGRPSSDAGDRCRADGAGRRHVRRADSYPVAVLHQPGDRAGRRWRRRGLLQRPVGRRPERGWPARHRRRGCLRRDSGAVQHLRSAGRRPLGRRSGLCGSRCRGRVSYLRGHRHQPRSGPASGAHVAPVD